MPAEFDRMRKAIKKGFIEQGMKDEDAEKKSWAVATMKWKETHGKAPSREEMLHMENVVLEYYSPIRISEAKVDAKENDGKFRISGMAVDETISLNNIRYLAEELKTAAPSFANRPILKDHENRIDSIVGRTETAWYDEKAKGILFEGVIMDQKCQDMISDGRIQTVSIGAGVNELVEEEINGKKALTAKGIKGQEISLVAVQGVEHATLNHSMAVMITEAYNSLEGAKMAEETNATEQPSEVEALKAKIAALEKELKDMHDKMGHGGKAMGEEKAKQEITETAKLTERAESQAKEMESLRAQVKEMETYKAKLAEMETMKGEIAQLREATKAQPKGTVSEDAKKGLSTFVTESFSDGMNFYDSKLAGAKTYEDYLAMKKEFGG